MVKKVDGLHMSTSRTQLADLEADTCFAELLFTIPGYVSFTQIRRWDGVLRFPNISKWITPPVKKSDGDLRHQKKWMLMISDDFFRHGNSATFVARSASPQACEAVVTCSFISDSSRFFDPPSSYSPGWSWRLHVDKFNQKTKRGETRML